MRSSPRSRPSFVAAAGLATCSRPLHPKRNGEPCFDERCCVVIFAHDLSASPTLVHGVAVCTMTPGEFNAKWRASELKNSAAAQSHFTA